MPSRSLQKVQKHISKKKRAPGELHEESRDARRLRRAGARDERVARITAVRSKGRQSFGMQ